MSCTRNRQWLQEIHPKTSAVVELFIVTDQKRAVIMRGDSFTSNLNPMRIYSTLCVHLTDEMSLRCVIAAALHFVSCELDDERGGLIPPEICSSKSWRTCSVEETNYPRRKDGDTEQQWDKAMDDHRRRRLDRPQHKIKTGTILEIHPNRCNLETAIFHYPHSPVRLPQDTDRVLCGQKKRERLGRVVDMLRDATQSKKALYLKVDQVASQHDPSVNRYSVVVVGTLRQSSEDDHGSPGSTVCLKLIHRSLLSFASRRQRNIFEEKSSPLNLFLNELSVYQRMEMYQGSLLPFMYGAVEVRALNWREVVYSNSS